MSDYLTVTCSEWLEIAEMYPAEMAVLMEMVLDAELEFCT